MATIETRRPARPSSSTPSPTGTLGPDVPMLGPVADGGHIVVNTTPGCWGPMITPSIRGGHEVCTPVAVEGAAGRRRDRDPHPRHRGHLARHRVGQRPDDGGPLQRRSRTARRCARECGTEWPETRVEGIGPESIRCANCGADATPFTFTNGYTIAFDPTHTVGVTVGEQAAEALRPRRRADGGAARQLAPEPDPAVRAARHRRHGDAAAAVHGPARHHAVDDDARLAQRRRLRLVPGRRAARASR